jgi:hypothetical protein
VANKLIPKNNLNVTSIIVFEVEKVSNYGLGNIN